MTAKQPGRKPVLAEIEKQVLTKGRRRCPLCFRLENDARQKKGQIAHLDRRRSNSIEDNLVFLCLDHHTEYDSVASQHKNYTIEEVKGARRALYLWVAKGMPPIAGSSNSLAKPRASSTNQRGTHRRRAVQPYRPPVGALQLPETRPKITPASYGKISDGHEGLHISNEGTPAYDVQIQTISLQDGWSVQFDEISRWAGDGFACSFTARKNESILSLGGLWRGLWNQPPVLPLIIKYRDFEGRRYRSICELHRDVMKKSGFDVRFVRQE